MWRIPDTFVASPLEQLINKAPVKATVANPWGEAKPAQPAWGSPPKSVIPTPIIENAEDKKRLFAIELAKVTDPFQAACNVCGQNTQEALWISKNWINDPNVVGYKDGYLNSAKTTKTLLDKDELAAKFLTMSEEKSASGSFYILEGKDRLKALELYAKIQGYLDSKDNTKNNFIHNQMIVKFVKPDVKEVGSREISSNAKIIDNEGIVPLKVKLISSG